jgi:hypothetical protein
MSEAASSPRRAFGQDAVEEIMGLADTYRRGETGPYMQERRDALEQRIRQLVEQNEQMREALEKHGYHGGGCAALMRYQREYTTANNLTISNREADCDCGLRAALLRSEGGQL